MADAAQQQQQQPPPPVPPLPFFDDAWQLKSRQASFEGMIAANDVLGLNVMRDMTAARSLHVVREGSGATGAFGGVAPSAAEGCDCVALRGVALCDACMRGARAHARACMQQQR